MESFYIKTNDSFVALMIPFRKLNLHSIDVYCIDVRSISTYINLKMFVCLSVCLFGFFLAIQNQIGIPFGTKLLFGHEKVLTKNICDMSLH